MRKLGDILQKQVQQLRDMQMKKILNHYLSGGTLVSPEGRKLYRPTDSDHSYFTDNLGRESPIEEHTILGLLAAHDWEIQREPGVYRVSMDDEDAAVVLVSWDGRNWREPVVGVIIESPADELIIERVEAEPKKNHNWPDGTVLHNEDYGITVMDRLKQMAGGFVPDWGSNVEVKSSICYNYDSQVWETRIARYTMYPGVVYFRTEEEAQAAIDELGEELRG